MNINIKRLMVNDKEAATILSVAPQTLRHSRCTGYLLGIPAPKHIKFGKSVRYKVSEIESWVKGLEGQL